jgi:hypothetical protein
MGKDQRNKIAKWQRQLPILLVRVLERTAARNNQMICPSCSIQMDQYPGYASIFECSQCKQLRTTARGDEVRIIKFWEGEENVERV